jgi:acyl-CoA dehydrogenase
VNPADLNRARGIAARVEQFVRAVVIPYERDARWGRHGPSGALVGELRDKARAEGLLTPHLSAEGNHLSHRGVALVLRAAGLSPLGPVALNVAAPDEGNMYLLGKIASDRQKREFLLPLIDGRARSAFFMTEPAAEGGAGSDPAMMQTTARRDDDAWIIDGSKAFITGADGAAFGIIMTKTAQSSTMFIVPLPDPRVRIERIYDTIDGSMPGGHALVRIDQLRVSAEQILGEEDQGFKYAQVRLAPARLTHCMRWLGAAIRCQEVATDYAVKRMAFGKPIIDHEGVGFMLANNAIELKQCELMIDWGAQVLDSGASGTAESSMVKVAVSEALFRVVDRCVQILGGMGVTRESIVEQVFREIRAFRIYDGPTEVHKWSLAKTIKRNALREAAP